VVILINWISYSNCWGSRAERGKKDCH